MAGWLIRDWLGRLFDGGAQGFAVKQTMSRSRASMPWAASGQRVRIREVAEDHLSDMDHKMTMWPFEYYEMELILLDSELLRLQVKCSMRKFFLCNRASITGALWASRTPSVDLAGKPRDVECTKSLLSTGKFEKWVLTGSNLPSFIVFCDEYRSYSFIHAAPFSKADMKTEQIYRRAKTKENFSSQWSLCSERRSAASSTGASINSSPSHIISSARL